MMFGAMLRAHPLRRVQVAVVALALFMTWYVVETREDDSLALTATELAGLAAGGIVTLWMLEREGRQSALPRTRE